MEQTYKKIKIFGREELASLGGAIFREGRKVTSIPNLVYRVVDQQLEGFFQCEDCDMHYPNYTMN